MLPLHKHSVTSYKRMNDICVPTHRKDRTIDKEGWTTMTVLWIKQKIEVLPHTISIILLIISMFKDIF